MFIKLNGRVTSSDVISSISIEPVYLNPFKTRIWADTKDGMRVSLGTFLKNDEAKLVLDQFLFPNIQNDKSIDLDEYYLHVDTMETVHNVMNPSERKKWYDEHRHLFDTGESGNEEELK